jgi:site-specific recombinase XerD
MRFKGVAEGQFSKLVEAKDTRQNEADITDFIISLKEKYYSLASQQAYLTALIHFYSINDVMVRRKKIAKFLSNDDTVLPDILDNEEEGHRGEGDSHILMNKELLEFSDLRGKAMILLMCSSGTRLGALPLLKIADLIPIPTHIYPLVLSLFWL